MSTKLVALGILLAFFVTTTIAVAGTSPAAKCAVAKQKAAGKKLAARLKCYSTAVSKVLPVDPECLMKADTKFADAFTKAEAAGGCTVAGDMALQEAAVDSAVARIAAAEPATPVPPVFGQPCGTTCSGAGVTALLCAGNIAQPRPVCMSNPLAPTSCTGQLDCEIVLGPGFICVSQGPGCGGQRFCAKPCP